MQTHHKWTAYYSPTEWKKKQIPALQNGNADAGTKRGQSVLVWKVFVVFVKSKMQQMCKQFFRQTSKN